MNNTKRLLIFITIICLSLLTSCGMIGTVHVHYDYTHEVVEVARGGRIPEPITPTKEGHTFLGWYNGKNRWNFKLDAAFSDVYLYAKWQVNMYTLSFDSDGAEEYPSVLVEYHSSYTLPKPTKYGYTFAFWENEGERINYLKMPANDIVIKAIYDIDPTVWSYNHFERKITLFKGSAKHIQVPEHYIFDNDKWIFNTIGNSAFVNNNELETIEIRSNITTIEFNAFNTCTSLKSVELPNSLKFIGAFAFNYCTNLESIYIPLSVETIEYWAFNNCPKLTIYCEAEEKPIGWNDNWNNGCNVVWGYKK